MKKVLILIFGCFMFFSCEENMSLDEFVLADYKNEYEEAIKEKISGKPVDIRFFVVNEFNPPIVKVYYSKIFFPDITTYVIYDYVAEFEIKLINNKIVVTEIYDYRVELGEPIKVE